MPRVLRVLVVWLMVIAMPVQGMAMSAMLFCGPGHERTMQGLVPDGPHPSSGHASHTRHDAQAARLGGHQHAAAMHAEAHAAVDVGALPSGAETSTSLQAEHDPFGCSACAACCVAQALPARFELPEPASPARHAGMAPVTPVASHQPDGLDRPPRARLA